MEVGAVKQAFNNEIILLKKNLNQAKIQTIHKLTRKAKTLTEKKVPELQMEKLKRKAESAVKEVLIIKKIKARDIAKFIVTHSGKLNDYLNKPIVNIDKACARLLLHKAMQQKYNFIREKFSNISIKDLFMSRQERIKLKKEAREKQKNKKKGKNKSEVINIEGQWDIEMDDGKNNILPGDYKVPTNNDSELLDGNKNNDSNNESEEDKDTSENEQSNISEDEKHNQKINLSMINKDLVIHENDQKILTNNSDSDSISDSIDVTKTKDKIKKGKDFSKKSNEKIVLAKKNISKKAKESKNKNLNKKLENRNFHKDSEETPIQVSKMVDPFFITSTGENYVSLVEPRHADEVKEVHKEGNRKYRRAVMFGHVPPVKSRKSNFEHKNNFFNKQNMEDMPNKNNNKQYKGAKQVNGKILDKTYNKENPVDEKLHPSWEAKKKQSTILPFQGKKIVFDES